MKKKLRLCQLKAGYNVQIATEGQYALAYSLFSNPTDTHVSKSKTSHRKDKYDFTREFKVYECEDCSGYPFRSACTKVKEGNNKKNMSERGFQKKKRVPFIVNEK